jgi:hypothetical protein
MVVMVMHLRIRRERALGNGSLGGGRNRESQGGNGNERKQRPHGPLSGFVVWKYNHGNRVRQTGAGKITGEVK